MAKSPEVALLIKTDSDWHRDIIRGIARFTNEKGLWSFTLPQAEESGEVFLPPDWRGSGIICRLTSEELYSQIKLVNVPAVNVSWRFDEAKMPRVVSDEEQCGQMVAEYFLEKQYSSFGYIGFPSSSPYQPVIEETIREVLRRRKLQLNSFELSRDPRYEMGMSSAELQSWLMSIPKPAAIVGWSSFDGYKVALACKRVGLSIPQEVSIVCIEHDSLWSGIAPVPLSNLDQDPFRVGYTAAAVLDSLMSGKKLKQRSFLVPPISVVERFSSKVTAVSDPVLKMALEYIAEHFRDGLTVRELCRILGVSRRSLEANFKQHLNCTPAAHIRSQQLRAVANMLRNTSKTVNEIARETGYDYPEVLMRTFKRKYGLTPMQFRNSGKRCIG